MEVIHARGIRQDSRKTPASSNTYALRVSVGSKNTFSDENRPCSNNYCRMCINNVTKFATRTHQTRHARIKTACMKDGTCFNRDSNVQTGRLKGGRFPRTCILAPLVRQPTSTHQRKSFSTTKVIGFLTHYNDFFP